MKLEEYKKYDIHMVDFDYLKSKCFFKIPTFDDCYCSNDLESNYPKFIIDSFDKITYFQLSYIVRRLIRNYHERKIFDMSMTILYWLIEKGEEYLKHDRNVEIIQRLSSNYLLLGELLYDDKGLFVLSYDYHIDDYGIEKDRELAVYYWEKAYLINPNSTSAIYNLGMYHYCNYDYYQAFGFLIRTGDYCNDGRWYYRLTDNVYHDISVFLELGDKFYKNYWSFFGEKDEKKAFLCYERAYLIAEEYYWDEKENIEDVLYNLARCYIQGIGTKINIAKGRSLLRKLNYELNRIGKSISVVDDYDNIIKDYYIKSK